MLKLGHDQCKNILKRMVKFWEICFEEYSSLAKSNKSNVHFDKEIDIGLINSITKATSTCENCLRSYKKNWGPTGVELNNLGILRIRI